jgi:hypothetical protein
MELTQATKDNAKAIASLAHSQAELTANTADIVALFKEGQATISLISRIAKLGRMLAGLGFFAAIIYWLTGHNPH